MRTARLDTSSSSLRVQPNELPARIEALVERLRAAEKELAGLRSAALTGSAATLAAEAVTVGGVAVVAASAPEGTAAGDVRNLATDVRGRLGARPGVAAIFAPGEGSVAFSVALTPTAVAAGWSAGDLVKSFLPEIEGRGGGKKDMAQGAGTRPAGIPAAVTALQAAVARGNR